MIILHFRKYDCLKKHLSATNVSFVPVERNSTLVRCLSRSGWPKVAFWHVIKYILLGVALTHNCPKHLTAIQSIIFMASSMSGQDEPNPTLWLATQADKMALSCPLGITRCNPQETFSRKPYNKSFIDQVCLVKMAGYWLGKALGQYPTIKTSPLVNNPHIF